MPPDWWRVAGKEIGVGLLIGGTLGIGTLLPFVLVRFGQNPTVVSSPLVTSLTDAVGLLIYSAIATLLLLGHAC